MQETYQHKAPQSILPKGLQFEAIDIDGTSYGLFWTLGAANFVLGCYRQIRESQERRKGVIRP